MWRHSFIIHQQPDLVNLNDANILHKSTPTYNERTTYIKNEHTHKWFTFPWGGWFMQHLCTRVFCEKRKIFCIFHEILALLKNKILNVIMLSMKIKRVLLYIYLWKTVKELHCWYQNVAMCFK